MEDRTVVVFRKFRGGEIIALFPEELATTNMDACMGQHSACDPYAIKDITEWANPSEYELLEMELKRIGYILNIQNKITRKMHNNRHKKYMEYWRK